MPTHKATWKSLKQDKERRSRNVAEKSRLKTELKKVRFMATSGDQEKIVDELKKASSILDKAAKRQTIHPKKADRLKSRLQRMANKTGS